MSTTLPPLTGTGTGTGAGTGGSCGESRPQSRDVEHHALGVWLRMARHQVVNVEKLRHGLPDTEGWARLAREARRVPFAEQTPRRSEGEPRDGRRRATRSLRRANS